MAHLLGRPTVNVDPIDFLEEAIADFLESGDRPKRIVSSVIKTATSVELLLKEKLSKICPSLILELFDQDGLQIVKAHQLARMMLHPQKLERVEIKTARFPVLLSRCAVFFDIESAIPDLLKLYRLRNSLIHHRFGIEMLETNLLLIQKVFPFLENLTKDHKYLKFRIPVKTWEKLRKLEKACVDSLAGNLAKKLAHYEALAEKIPAKRVVLLIKSNPEPVSGNEEILDDGLVCPACQNESLSCIRAFDVDYDDRGMSSGYLYFYMRCKVCGVLIEEDEIRHIVDHFEDFIGKAEEKQYWQQVFQPDLPDEY
jgi:transcription elongation factor Elf1